MVLQTNLCHHSEDSFSQDSIPSKKKKLQKEKEENVKPTS